MTFVCKANSKYDKHSATTHTFNSSEIDCWLYTLSYLCALIRNYESGFVAVIPDPVEATSGALVPLTGHDFLQRAQNLSCFEQLFVRIMIQ